MDVLCFSLQPTSGLRAVTAASASIALGGGEGEQVRIVNLGANPVAILASQGAATAIFPTDAATSNGKGAVLAAGSTETFTLPHAADTLSFICAAGLTSTVSCSRGKGQ